MEANLCKGGKTHSFTGIPEKCVEKEVALHPHTHTHTHTHMHICMYVCIYIYLYTYAYMCVQPCEGTLHTHTHTHTHTHAHMYMYVHTCYVLVIPSSRCKHFVNLRPVEILLHKRANTRVPPCNDLNT